MISKNLTIAAAFVLVTGLGFGPALAQNTPPAEPTMAAPSPSGDAAAPAAAPAPTGPAENPYGLGHIVETGNPVSLTVLALLAIMSAGTWYIFFMKFFEQSRILTQARTVEKRFWTSGGP